MKPNNKIQNKPNLRKKNGVWIKILVPMLCIVAGAGAMAGLTYGVPSVGNMLIKQNTQVKPDSELQTQIKELKIKLEEANNLASTRLTKINELNTQIEINQTEKQNLLNQIETIKESAELSDSQKQKQINTLTIQVEALETTNTTLTAQLNQAVVDKEQAESVVAGLQAQIAELQAKIDKYEGNAIVDTLKLENFEGTWYKEGTFEDYFVINDKVITRGANIDKGVVYRLDNQVYFGLNSLNNTAVTLSENGTKITLADGTVYKNSYINTVEETTINMGWLSGEYSHSETKIVLNSDNTASYFDGIETKAGAFTAKATKKNVGGNITITHYIELTLNNSDETQTTMELIMVGNGDLVNGDINYTKTYIENFFGKTKPSDNYYKLTVKFKKTVTVDYRGVGLWIGNISGLYINGCSNSSSSQLYTYGITDGNSNSVTLDYLTLYITNSSAYVESEKIANLVFYDAKQNFNSSTTHYEYYICNFEKVGNPANIKFASGITDNIARS